MSRKRKGKDASGELFAPKALGAGRPLQGFMFDVDGTLVLGDRYGAGYELMPGAAEVLETLNEHGVPFVLLTNGTHRTPQEAAAKLRSAGLAVADEQMLTPSSVAANIFASKGVDRALVLGGDSVSAPLEEAGVEAVRPGDPDESEVAAVYVGWHPDCDMTDIEAGAKAVWGGAKLYTASDVPFFATRDGRAIGYSRAIVAAIRSLTNARVTVTGKPSPSAFDYVMRLLDAPADRIAVVGDDPELEVGMARKGGAAAFGVCTGLTKREAWESQTGDTRPDMILDTVGDLIAIVEKLDPM